jgi:GNAT superfamily N-acetyltransferase
VTRHHIVPATARDVGTLTEVIAEAFHGLAPSRWLIPSPVTRRQVFPGYFRLIVRHAMATGVVHTNAARTATALWLPVGESGPTAPAGYGAKLAEVTGPHAERFAAFDAALERHHPAGRAHHHLAILAVHPGQQRQGTGTALLAAYHTLLDDAGMPAYLEASGPGTRALYLRHGYRDHGEPIRLPGGPLMFPMWRWPAGALSGR